MKDSHYWVYLSTVVATYKFNHHLPSYEIDKKLEIRTEFFAQCWCWTQNIIVVITLSSNSIRLFFASSRDVKSY